MNFTYTADPAPGAMILQFGRGNVRQTIAFVEALTRHDSIGDPMMLGSGLIVSQARR